MCMMKETISELSKGMIIGHKSRAKLISQLMDALEEMQVDEETVKTLVEKVFFRAGAEDSKDYEGDDPDDFIRFMTRINMEVFDKEIIKTDKDHSVVRFHYCPLHAAWCEMGLPPERIKYLCDVAGRSDYGRASNFKNIKFEMTKRLAAGDPYCELDAKRITE